MDTKKLRQKILDLAIRGKLVPQDPNDEPASVLLERIRAEKERLIKEGKIKRSKKTVSDGEIEAPFEIPESWEWTPLSMLIKMISGTSYSKNDVKKDGVRILRGGNIQNNELFFPDQIFKDFVPVLKGYPVNIKYGNMSNDTKSEKERLLKKWTFS